MSRPIGIFVLVAAALPPLTVPVAGQTVPPDRKEQVDRLIAVLQSSAPQEEKQAACRELATVGTNEAVPALAALLGDKNLSHVARYALEPIAGPAVDEALRKALGEVKGRALVGVIGSVGARRDAKAVDSLTRLLDDPDPEAAQAAAGALGRIGTVEAAQALAAALVVAPAANRLALCEGLFRAAETLAASGHRSHALAIYDGLLRLPGVPHQVVTGAVRGTILALGKDSLPSLRRFLQSDDGVVFAATVRTTYEMPGRAVTGLLVEELQRTALADRQVLLIHALAGRRDPWALSKLWARAEGGPSPVRLAAIRAVAQSGAAAMAPALIQLLDDPDRELARAARESLAIQPGYLAWAARAGLSAEQRLALCREAANVVEQPKEKRMLLAVLSGVPSAEAIALAVPYLDEAETRDEACAAIVSVAESLLRGQNARLAAPKLIEPLAEVARVAANADVARRAKAALEEARNRAK